MRKSKLASSPLTRNETHSTVSKSQQARKRELSGIAARARGAWKPPSFLSHPPSCALRRR